MIADFAAGVVLTGLTRYVEYRPGDLDELEDTSDRFWVVAVALHFSEGVLVVEVDPDDDTVAMRLSEDVDLVHWPDAIEADRSQRSAWSTRLGSDCVWRWLLTNQQGYQDGAQVELSRDGSDSVVQWIAQASSLRVAHVVDPKRHHRPMAPVDRQLDPDWSGSADALR